MLRVLRPSNNSCILFIFCRASSVSCTSFSSLPFLGFVCLIKTMRKSISFKDEFSFEERFEESRDIISKYPDRVPVIAEKYCKTDLPQMEKKKYLVPRDMSVGQFIHVLNNRLHLAPGKALFVFVHNTLPQTATLMGSLYESFKDEDGFMYMCYSSEKTFGYAHPSFV